MSRLSFNFKNLKAGLSRAQSRGFTIIEMITVVAIITIMTGVVLANFPDFRERASLELVAQEVSLVIRQAQAFGAQTRSIGSGAFPFPSYGVYFNFKLNDPNYPALPKGAFVLFGDGSGTADQLLTDDDLGACGQAGRECREVYTLSGGLEFVSITGCLEEACTSPQTTTFGTVPYVSGQLPLNIVFQRPDPEAIFKSQAGSTLLCGGASSPCTLLRIRIKSTRNNATKDIYVWNTGHIYVK